MAKTIEPIICPDGLVFESVAEMLDYYDVNRKTYYGRLTAGWTLRAALGLECDERNARKVTNSKFAVCPKGVLYASKHAMCAAYGVSTVKLIQRLKSGIDFETALNPKRLPRRETAVRGTKSFDHNGVEYASATALAQAYDLTLATLKQRLGRGWTLEKALTEPIGTRGRARKNP
jgi:hypothetical protein